MLVLVRRWRRIRAVGAAACLVVGVIYILSLKRNIYWSVGTRTYLGVSAGGLWLGWNPAGVPGFGRNNNLTWWPVDLGPSGQVFWWFRLISGPSPFSGFAPLWVPLLAVAVPTGFAWWPRSRFPHGHCQYCGYDLAGNTTGVCSECGKAAGTMKR